MFVTFRKTPISALKCLDKYVTPKMHCPNMTDQIIVLQYTLGMMGVPLDYHSYAFRDNHAIIQ